MRAQHKPFSNQSMGCTHHFSVLSHAWSVQPPNQHAYGLVFLKLVFFHLMVAASLFSARIKSVKSILTLVKSIHFKNTATCYIYDEGLTLTVEESRCVKAIAYLKSHLFQDYFKQREEIAMFGLPMNALIDCLGLMLPQESRSPDCELSYHGPGSPLRLERQDKEAKQSFHCQLYPSQPETESLDSLMTPTDLPVQKMISKADWFRDFLDDLDKSCERIAFGFHPHNHFTFSASGKGIHYETSYPEHSEPFILFQCDQALSFSYLYSHIILCKKALEHATEVSIEMSSHGSLCILFQIEGHLNTKDFIEFTFIPLAT
ncbi:repair protein Rad1/Rec1/Rad17-domain-containing protein [Sporodiniella umbellata]|nr:repair protein Rad1/Rec1/Rad17-domain-containing protein [Sporodiniella umbellata]